MRRVIFIELEYGVVAYKKRSKHKTTTCSVVVVALVFSFIYLFIFSDYRKFRISLKRETNLTHINTEKKLLYV